MPIQTMGDAGTARHREEKAGSSQKIQLGGLRHICFSGTEIPAGRPVKRGYTRVSTKARVRKLRRPEQLEVSFEAQSPRKTRPEREKPRPRDLAKRHPTTPTESPQTGGR